MGPWVSVFLKDPQIILIFSQCCEITDLGQGFANCKTPDSKHYILCGHIKSVTFFFLNPLKNVKAFLAPEQHKNKPWTGSGPWATLPIPQVRLRTGWSMAWTRHHETRYHEIRNSQEGSTLNPQVWAPALQLATKLFCFEWRWESFGLTLIKLPRYIINQPAYYFLVRCRTFTMQTEYVCQREEHIFFLEAVTQKTRLSVEPKQGEAILKLQLIHKARAHFPNTGTDQPQRTWRTRRLSSLSYSG